MIEAVVFAADFRGIGLTIAVILLIAFVALFARNIFVARGELGSELELAANRQEYLSDEELEGPKLDRSLGFALVVLTITAILLPFYWLAEPGRQDGAVATFQATFERRGESQYTVGAQCVTCHAAGGVGGSAAYVLQDSDGQFVANTAWTAPALNNLMSRYSEEEITYILNFGRPGSPMAAWGTPGGGPLTTQQVGNLIAYITTFQVANLDPIEINKSEEPEVMQAEADEIAAEIRGEVDRSIAAGEFDSVGEAVFNLGYFSGYQAGSLSCGRCHTAGWSLGPLVPHVPGTEPLAPGIAGCGGGTSGIGFSLCGGISDRFPDDAWKLPDGTWAPDGGLSDDDGFYYLAMDGSEIRLDEKGSPITNRVDSNGPVPYEILTGGATDGDLAQCRVISSLWEPEGISSDAYPYDPILVLVPDESDDGFENPEPLDLSRLGDDFVEFADGRVGVECEVVDMPERTSRAHYNFVFNGAEAGVGYGRGGQSHAGMMPSFGGMLPPELIEAVVDYERGLS